MFEKKLWAFKIARVAISRILGLQFRSLGTKWHLGVGPMARHKKYYKGGRWWLPLNSSYDEFCKFVFACGLSVHQKCSNYALTNLWFGLCGSMWVIDLLVTLPIPSPYLGVLARPFISKVLRVRELASTLSPSIVFTFGLAVKSIKELGGASLWTLIFECQEWVWTFLFSFCNFWITIGNLVI